LRPTTKIFGLGGCLKNTTSHDAFNDLDEAISQSRIYMERQTICAVLAAQKVFVKGNRDISEKDRLAFSMETWFDGKICYTLERRLITHNNNKPTSEPIPLNWTGILTDSNRGHNLNPNKIYRNVQ
jgi:hypothetical protein